MHFLLIARRFVPVCFLFSLLSLVLVNLHSWIYLSCFMSLKLSLYVAVSTPEKGEDALLHFFSMDSLTEIHRVRTFCLSAYLCFFLWLLLWSHCILFVWIRDENSCLQWISLSTELAPCSQPGMFFSDLLIVCQLNFSSRSNISSSLTDCCSINSYVTL